MRRSYGARGIQALAFSSSGAKLATISLDNSHTLTLWDWTRGQKLLERKSQPGAPPAVYGVVWSHHEPDRWGQPNTANSWVEGEQRTCWR